MRVTLILPLTAAIALAGLTLTRAAREEPAPAPPGPRPPIASPPPQQASDHSAVGTLDQVDTVARQITVATASGRIVFRVQNGATVRQGSKTLKPAELAAHRGERVKVRYRDSGGERRADWIVLAVPAKHPKVKA